MAKDPLFSNKLFSAVLLAGVIATGSGFVADLLYKTDTLEEDSYVIAVEETSVDSGESQDPVDITMWQEVNTALMAAQTGELAPFLASGEKLFKKCSACHTIAEGGPNKTGPNLWNTVNRPIASVADYAYSAALSAMQDRKWDFEQLNAFLTKPKVYAPGTKMSYAGLKKPSDRVALLLYLAAQGE